MTAAVWRRVGALFVSAVLIYALVVFIVGVSSVLARITT